MRYAMNFHPEWGCLAPAPSFLRTMRTVLVATAVGATPARLHSPDFAVDDTVRAYRTAVEQRRTVVLALPLDVQAGECAAPVPGRPGAPAAGRSGSPEPVRLKSPYNCTPRSSQVLLSPRQSR